MTTAGRVPSWPKWPRPATRWTKACEPRSRTCFRSCPTDEKGKPDGKSSTHAAQDAEALAAQKLNAEVGTKIAEGRRLHETDPDKAIAIYEKTVQAVQAAGLSPDLTRPMVRRLEVAIELATKDKVAFEAKMQDKQLRAEIEMKRLRILEADKAKKMRMKDLMDKAITAYAEGNYVECEAFAKRAMEVDPNELAASMLVFKAKTERRFKQDLQNRNDKEEGVVTAFQGVDMAAIADPEVQMRDIKFAKNFKDLTKSRLAMNAKLEPRKDPKVMAIEAKLKDRISMNMDKQPLSEAVTFLTNYTGLNIVLDPKALADEGLSIVVAGEPGRQSGQAQDGAEADASAARADLQARGRRDLDHQPAGDPGTDDHADLLCRRPGHAAGSWPSKPVARHDVLSRSRIRRTDPNAGFGA